MHRPLLPSSTRRQIFQEGSGRERVFHANLTGPEPLALSSAWWGFRRCRNRVRLAVRHPVVQQRACPTPRNSRCLRRASPTCSSPPFRQRQRHCLFEHVQSTNISIPLPPPEEVPPLEEERSETKKRLFSSSRSRHKQGFTPNFGGHLHTPSRGLVLLSTPANKCAPLKLPSSKTRSPSLVTKKRQADLLSLSPPLRTPLTRCGSSTEVWWYSS